MSARPLIVTDCDEVLLHMVTPFEAWLDEAHQIDFALEKADFASALTRRADASVVEAEHIGPLLDAFFTTEMHRQTLVPHAARALAKGKAEAAVGYAEHAVQLRPQDAGYRALLGKVYLAAGRFFSAKQAFADALQLDPNQPGAALSLALATTATGDFSAAQEILNANANTISPADRGLAYALAGNPARRHTLPWL